MDKFKKQLMEYAVPMEEIEAELSKLLPEYNNKPNIMEEIKRSQKPSQKDLDNDLMEIRYVPSRNYVILSDRDDVSIVSEFTNWKQEIMSREHRDGEYIYTCKYPLQSGFKYKFRFLINGNPVNDIGYPDIKNTLGQSCNYLVVHGEAGIPLMKNKSYINPLIGSQARQEAIKRYFGALNLTKDNKEIVKEGLNDCIGRLIYRFKDQEGLFEVLKWNEEDKEAILKRITDNNKVPLDPKFHTKNEYLFLHELKDQFFFIGTKEEELAAISALTVNCLKVKFKKNEDRNLATGEVLRYYETVSIEPDNIPVQEVYSVVPVVHNRVRYGHEYGELGKACQVWGSPVCCRAN